MLKSTKNTKKPVLVIKPKFLYAFYYLLIIIALGSCGSQKYGKLGRLIQDYDTPDHYFSGLLILDPGTGDTLFRKNSEKYFTPASNTKIFTLYASLKLLGDKIPAAKYAYVSDTLHIEGTGDPTALHPFFKDSTLLNFLHKYRNIAFHPSNFHETAYAPGWAWEDYQYAFSPERSSLPLYGNVLELYANEELKVQPDLFREQVQRADTSLRRELSINRFYYPKNSLDTLRIPFKTSSALTKRLLDTLTAKEIRLSSKPISYPKTILEGHSLDSVLVKMMQESDNFLSEQLLLMGSAMISDTLNSAIARDFVLENYLSDLNQPPRWVDGSGLSRYNLFSPESMVDVLHKLYLSIQRERLLGFFPAGGVSGTLEDWYSGDTEPYVFAKTGTLGNNHNLSGYMVTKSGKTLIFSFMNNHFRLSNSEIKEKMQRILERVRDRY